MGLKAWAKRVVLGWLFKADTNRGGVMTGTDSRSGGVPRAGNFVGGERLWRDRLEEEEEVGRGRTLRLLLCLRFPYSCPK